MGVVKNRMQRLALGFDIKNERGGKKEWKSWLMRMDKGDGKHTLYGPRDNSVGCRSGSSGD